MDEVRLTTARRAKRWLRSGWIVCLAGLLLASAGLGGVWASPPAQTIPRATPTATNAPLPTATPFNSGGGSGSGSRPATATPVAEQAPAPAATPTAAASPATNADADDANASNASANTDPNADTATVDVVALNVREGPDTDFPVIGTLMGNSRVDLLGRNVDGDWVRICCISDSAVEGWVSAGFVTPSFAPQLMSERLRVLQNDGRAVSSALSVSDSATESTASLAQTSLTLEADREMLLAIQGDAATLDFTLTNTGDEEALSLALSTEVPVGLTLEDTTLSGNGVLLRDTSDSGAEIIVVTWERVASGESVTAAFVLSVEEDVVNGAVIDSLVSASATNADAVSSGVSIGLPPAAPPTFR